MKAWYDSAKNDLNITGQPSTSKGILRKIKVKELTIDLIKKGQTDFTLCGRVTFIKTAQKYKACSQTNCKKKLKPISDTKFICDKCKHETTEFVYRIIVNALFVDPTGQIWVTIFQDKIEKFIGFKIDNEIFENELELSKCIDILKNQSVEMNIYCTVQLYDKRENLKYVCTDFKNM